MSTTEWGEYEPVETLGAAEPASNTPVANPILNFRRHYHKE